MITTRISTLQPRVPESFGEVFRSLKIAALPGPDKSGGRLRPRFEAGGAVRHFVSSGVAATDPPEPRLCVCESGRMTDVGIEHTTPMTHYPCEVDVHVVRTSSTINSAIGINHVQSPSMPRSDMAVAWQGEHLGRHASCAVGAVAGKVGPCLVFGLQTSVPNAFAK